MVKSDYLIKPYEGLDDVGRSPKVTREEAEKIFRAINVAKMDISVEDFIS